MIRAKKIFVTFCLIFLFCSFPGFAEEQLFYVITIPELGDYYLDISTLYREGDVITYGYKSIMSEQAREHMLQLLKGQKRKKDRQIIKEEAFSMSFSQINPQKELWRPVSYIAYSKTGRILYSNDTSNFPFAPIPPVGSVERCIIASVMMHRECIKDK